MVKIDYTEDVEEAEAEVAKKAKGKAKEAEPVRGAQTRPPGSQRPQGASPAIKFIFPSPPTRNQN